jgi:cytochrome c-type biogenesis protein CcmH/NrfG
MIKMVNAGGAIGEVRASNSLKDGNMAETTGSGSFQRWTSTQAYIMAVLCLLVGGAVGYLLRGSGGSSSAPAPVAAEQQAPPAGAEQQQMPSPEQMKAIADKQAQPLLDQLKTKPNDPALLAQIGNVYYDAHQFPAAVQYYQKVLAITPKNTSVRTDMATAMFYSNDIDGAIAEFDHALKDNPKDGNALFNRGICKWQGKMDVKGAMADWELLLKENPKYEQADKVRMFIAQAKKHLNMKPIQTTDKPAM